ncbi:MAG: A/G-specific adenine glycosylase [Phycisphaeraceae bacterium]|nr:A/G-specific adenine glycosylase [Phycisphaeraceae bacterium]
MAQAIAGKVRRGLLAWYRREYRQLPWRVAPRRVGDRRSAADPYRVLVSEAMLQQTQVATVVDYYRRFIERFPTIEHLAEAGEEEVYKLWEGLGYYRRARLLHRAARVVVGERAGRFPRCFEDLLRLPGVGRYTAGAVASIAFGRAVPAVDGNVIRVVSRILALPEPPDDPLLRKRCEKIAAQWVSPRDPGDFNQAMMELGAVVCRPRNPQCGRCPLVKLCVGRQSGKPERFGVGAKPATVLPVVHRVFVVEHEDKRTGRRRWIVERRGPVGLWSGLWQFLTIEAPAEGDQPQLESIAGIRLGARGGGKRSGSLMLHFDHRTTHRLVRFEVRWFHVKHRLNIGDGRKWADLSAVLKLPMSNPHRRILAALQSQAGVAAAR